MSTRTNIVVKGNDSVLYKHCDGYPEYVHPILVPLLKVFKSNRGNDPIYCLASILREFTRQEIISSSDWYKQIDRNSDEIPREFCYGYGIQNYLSEDIDYLYVVDLEHSGYLDTYEVISNGKLLHVSGKCLDVGIDNYRNIGAYNELTSVDQRFHHRRMIPTLGKVKLHLDC